MQPSAFKEDAPGQLIKNLDGRWTFVPNPLPPRFSWTAGLVNAIAEAEQALGRLAGLGHRSPSSERLTQMFLRREAELSSRIENTYATIRTQLLFQDLPELEKEAPDVREVTNNFAALEFGIQSTEHRPLSVGLIKEMHQILLKDVRGQDKSPGKFRDIQVYIGSSRRIEESRFVPPPPHMVEQCMRHLEEYMQAPDPILPLARAAMIHYQFEAIHPFADGNGRIGRVLILLLLRRERAIPLLFNPSAPLERNRLEYYDHLLNVSHRGEWGPWIEFFAHGVAEEAVDAIQRIEKLEQLRDQYQSRVRTRRASALLPELVDDLFGQPSITLRSVMKLLQIKAPSAQKLIDKLVDGRIVSEVTGKQRNRVYLAQEIVDLFSTRS